jgi:DNA mismatch endonuclease (patch repair protein)
LADIVSPEVRSRMMAGIRGRNTQPELFVRRALHALGYRFRLHDSGLPGRPDLVFRSKQAVILVNGCFWHGHDCHLFRWPGTRQAFWHHKIAGNIARDLRARQALLDAGWRVGEVWECQLKGRERQEPEAVIGALVQFLEGRDRRCVIGADQTVAARDRTAPQVAKKSLRKNMKHVKTIY